MEHRLLLDRQAEPSSFSEIFAHQEKLAVSQCEASQTMFYTATQGEALYNFGKSQSFPNTVINEAPMVGCTVQPNLRTAAHLREIAAHILNFLLFSKPSTQSTPLSPLRHKR
jgi:hypothetical protein